MQSILKFTEDSALLLQNNIIYQSIIKALYIKWKWSEMSKHRKAPVKIQNN